MTDLIDAYLAHCEADGGLATTTVETKRTVLEMFDRELPLGLERALEHELIGIIGRKTPDGQPRYKVRTKFVYTIHLKEFFKYSSDLRRPAHLRLTYDPAEGLSIPRVPRGVPRPLSDEQCQKILTEAREPYRTWAEIALLTGMRCCEIAGIDLDKGDITERRVTIRKGKGSKPRSFKTKRELWELVRGMPGGPLARRRDGVPVDAHYISTRSALHFRRSLKLEPDALGPVCMHRCRDTFASDLFAAGVDIRKIQVLLGHESLTTTQKYTLVTERQLDDAIDSLPLRRPAC
jgi:site-specific recombinase XerD